MPKKRVVKISKSKNREIDMLIREGNSMRQVALKARISDADLRRIMKGNFRIVKGLRKVM